MSRIGSFGQISEINSHLYLSGVHVLKPEKLRQKGITTIINATVEEPCMYLAGLDYLKIRIDDSPYAHLELYFDIVADKIKATKDKGGRTLVHCVAGVSRSPSLCIAYLIKYGRMNLKQAYKQVKACRPVIHPNIGFWKQLINYEKRLLGTNSVQLVPAGHEADTLLPDTYLEEQNLYRLSPTLSSSSFRTADVKLAHSKNLSPLMQRTQKRFYRRRSPSETSLQTAGLQLPGSSSSLSALALVSLPSKSRLKDRFFSSLYSEKSHYLFPSLF